jgi:DNA polymerase III epsilon subunit-like protein
MKHPILKLEELTDTSYGASDLDIKSFGDLRIWLFDLEATGLNTQKERVTQIAGVPLVRGEILEKEAFVQFVNPGEGVEIPAVVRELTGITPEMLVDQPTFSEAWSMCLEAAEGSDLWMGQSVFEFDVPLLEAEQQRHGMPAGLPPILDSVVMATALLGEPQARWSTSALIQHFDVSTEGLRRHDALDDVKILGRILIPMLELVRTQFSDRLHIPAGKPIAVRRHPPIKD